MRYTEQEFQLYNDGLYIYSRLYRYLTYEQCCSTKRAMLQVTYFTNHEQMKGENECYEDHYRPF